MNEANVLTISLGDEKIGAITQAKDGGGGTGALGDAKGAFDFARSGTALSRAAATMALVQVWLTRQQKEQSS